MPTCCSKSTLVAVRRIRCEVRAIQISWGETYLRHRVPQKSQRGGGISREEGIASGSEDGDAGADRQTQQGAATDAGTVGQDVAEFHYAARREVLAGFE